MAGFSKEGLPSGPEDVVLYSMGEEGPGKETQGLLDPGGEAGAAFTMAQRQRRARGSWRPRSGPESLADELTPPFTVGRTPSLLKCVLSSS